jgi:hypothetical protein
MSEITEDKIRAQKVGDEGLISGFVFAGSDATACPTVEKVHPPGSNA